MSIKRRIERLEAIPLNLSRVPRDHTEAVNAIVTIFERFGGPRLEAWLLSEGWSWKDAQEMVLELETAVASDLS